VGPNISFFTVIALLILLAATSLHFGVDSHGVFTTTERAGALHGIAVGSPACPHPEYRAGRARSRVLRRVEWYDETGHFVDQNCFDKLTPFSSGRKPQ
jgi:hypothetical protein